MEHECRYGFTKLKGKWNSGQAQVRFAGNWKLAGSDNETECPKKVSAILLVVLESPGSETDELVAH